MPDAKLASVLVIDDHMDTADSLSRFLRVAVGHNVRVAYDGPAGVRLAGEMGPDVVVCDIAMPKLSGLGVATALKTMDPKPLLIAVTAFAAEFPEAKAREAGFDYYLAKPVDPFVIETLIRDRKANGR
jgi:CheY-like chemotaxis protein